MFVRNRVDQFWASKPFLTHSHVDASDRSQRGVEVPRMGARTQEKTFRFLPCSKPQGNRVFNRGAYEYTKLLAKSPDSGSLSTYIVKWFVVPSFSDIESVTRIWELANQLTVAMSLSSGVSKRMKAR